uniref:Initiator protein NS1 n=1 Tax=Protoparvovirus primate3 TaxID=3052716 RepID=A0A649ZVJ9_9VIRU|nr:NSP1 [Protoparvovirus primate3]
MSGIKRILFDYFKTKCIEPKEVRWFIQAELGTDSGLHFHVLLQSDKIQQSSGKWMVKFFAEKWSLFLTQCIPMKKEDLHTFFNQTKFRHTVENNDWIQVLCYTHPQTKKKYVKPIFFAELIVNYFLNKNVCKTRVDTGYIYSSDGEFCFNDLNQESRQKISKHITEMLARQKETTVTDTKPQEIKKRRMETTKETNIKETIQTLTTKKLHTQEKWMLGDPDSYISHIANPGGETIIKATLDIVTLKMSVEKTAYDLIIETEHTKLKKAKKTKAWKLLKNNNFNPYKVFHAMMCCLNKQMGKRNTILLCGPASTGKSLIAQKIAQLVGNVGCYNASNVNFPFNDCSNKNLIWVEEAGNFGTQVNQFKTIMSGQAIRLDQKGKGSKTIEPTPVIMTTNEDITKVVIGSESKPEHRQPIMDRCIRIEMKKRLDGDFGLIEDYEIPTIFKHLVNKQFEPTMANYCIRWGGPPTWGENWNTKPKDITKQTEEEEEEEEDSQKSEEPTTSKTTKPTNLKSLAESLDPCGQDADFQLLLQSLEEDFAGASQLELGYGQDLLDTPPDACN